MIRDDGYDFEIEENKHQTGSHTCKKPDQVRVFYNQPILVVSEESQSHASDEKSSSQSLSKPSLRAHSEEEEIDIVSALPGEDEHRKIRKTN